MLDKTQVAKVAVAGFGAAMVSVFAIPEAHATIIPISFNPGLVPYGLNGPSASFGSKVKFRTSGGSTFASVLQWNDHIGKSINTGSGAASLAFTSVGRTLSPSTFNGGTSVAQIPGASGTGYIGFKSLAGNVGWFEIDWGGPHGAVKYLKGAYATDEGESIVVGQMSASVPEPSELGLFALGLLALGAAGVRLRREARKAAELN